MTIHYRDERVTLHHGDALDVLTEIPDESIDAVVTDPPYELGFMGRSWDNSGIAYNVDLWKHCLRVLKPGGHLLAFGGTRTSHRLACAIEDAGFEIRDSISWIYGSGFPKSLDVGKAIDKAAGAEREVIGEHHRHGGGSADSGSMSGPLGTASVLPLTAPATDDAKRWTGWGTALKPAHEPIVVARKPLGGRTVAANVLAHGTGALNIDARRVPTPDAPSEAAVSPNAGSRFVGVLSDGQISAVEPRTTSTTTAGRWPTNVLLDECAAAELDEQSGTSKSSSRTGRRTGKAAQDPGSFAGQDDVAMGHDDSGGASRFFPVFRYQAKAPTKERPKVNGVAHPTVKPLDLMRWLVRLVTPPDGVVLDPFAGSGTTAEACAAEGFRCVTIEREADYLPLILSRLKVEIKAPEPEVWSQQRWLEHFGLTS